MEYHVSRGDADIRTAAPTTINEEEGQQQQELPATFEAALEKVKQMPSTRDKLQAQIDKDNKAIEKLQKNTRLAELKSLVSRQLFRTEDKYKEELEKVYSWKGICDKDIADMYQAKLRSIDLGGQKRERISQHAVSKEKDREQVKSYSSSFSDSSNEDDNKESKELLI
jgi:hypothetical protein